jgi:uncharacterized protein YggE
MLENPQIKKSIVILATLLSVFVLTKTITELKSMGYIGKGVYAANSITVSGKGEVLATPDIATFSFGVTEEAGSVAEAQTKATEKANKILEAIKAAEVEDKDVKTSSYTIYPRYEYRGAGMYTSGTQYIAGYVVSQTVEVKVRKLENAGKLLSTVGEFGATNVSGLSFSVDKQDELARDARETAIKDARAQAKVLAGSLGVSLGRITAYYESAPYQPYPGYYAKDMIMSASGSARVEAAPELPAGENKIVSNVTITYEIR